MKKLLLLALLFCVKHNKAQTIFPAKGADWHYMTLNGLGSAYPSYYSNIEIKYTHDTIIGNHAAAVIYNSSYFEEEAGSGSNYFYSSHDSVFLYNAYSLNKWQLLYSFNTPVGQSWQFSIRSVSYNTDSANWTVHVDSVDHVIINNDTLKRMYVNYYDSTNNLHYTSSIIERIGDVTYLLNILDFGVYESCDGCNFIVGLICYQDSSFNLYQPDTTISCNYTTLGINQLSNNAQLKIYPNPACSSFVIEPTSFIKQIIKVFDVNGKIVLSQVIEDKTTIDISSLNEGIYTINSSSNEGVVNKKLVIIH